VSLLNNLNKDKLKEKGDKRQAVRAGGRGRGREGKKKRTLRKGLKNLRGDGVCAGIKSGRSH